MKRSGIQRKTSIRSSSSTRDAKPKERKSTGKHVGESAGRAALAKRVGDDKWCEVRLFGICLGRGGNAHHRRNRSQQGKWDVRNLLWVCGSGSTGCHGALTNTNGRRSEFEKDGLIVPSHEDPVEVECYIHTTRFGHDWVLLTDSFPWVELAEFPSGEPRHPDDIEVPAVDRGLGETA